METNFTAKDICRILDKCGKSGVKELTLGKLKVSFDDGVIRPDKNIIQKIHDSAGPSEENHQLFQDKETQDMSDQTQLMMDDPVEFEKLQVDAHLRKDDAESKHSGTERAL